jgi:5-methylcytosine-specific restriction endonuclease McrA
MELECPHCCSKTRVITARRKGKRLGWRRHECTNVKCKKRFTTHEQVLTISPLRRRRVGKRKQNYGRDWRARATAIRARDGNKCRVCGKAAADGERFPIDHIIPLRISHCHDLDNLITLCPSCHFAKNGAERKLRQHDRRGFEQGLKVLGWDSLIVARAFVAWKHHEKTRIVISQVPGIAPVPQS